MNISVCMATYNGERFLAEQLDSILCQLGPDDELVVSDDGSNDATLAILQRYGDRLRLAGTSRAGGVVANFSRALSAARGELVLLADQDDVWLSGRVERMRSALDRAELVRSNARIVDEALVPTGALLFDQVEPAAGFWHNVLRNSFVGCCIGFRRSLLERALPFPTMTPWHDWLLGLMASLHGRVEKIDEPLLLYRRHGANASLTGEMSSNSASRKLLIRMQVLVALVVCSLRRRNRPFP